MIINLLSKYKTKLDLHSSQSRKTTSIELTQDKNKTEM